MEKIVVAKNVVVRNALVVNARVKKILRILKKILLPNIYVSYFGNYRNQFRWGCCPANFKRGIWIST